MECVEWRRLATAMKCFKWQQQWLHCITAAVNSEGVRRMATSNGDGNGVRRVATAGSGDEVRRVTAMECAKWQWLATAIQCVECSALNGNVEWRRQWSASSGDGWQRR
jgi:hypothetical protein